VLLLAGGCGEGLAGELAGGLAGLGLGFGFAGGLAAGGDGAAGLGLLQADWVKGSGLLHPAIPKVLHTAEVICCALGQPVLCRDHSMMPYGALVLLLLT
jgi:hypothetical protein